MVYTYTLLMVTRVRIYGLSLYYKGPWTYQGVIFSIVYLVNITPWTYITSKLTTMAMPHG